MAFVNEFVPEAQKSKFDPKVFLSPASPNKSLRPFRWTIDRARDVFLIPLGGGPGGGGPDLPKVFALSWKGEVVKFDARQSAKGSNEDGWIVDWDVLKVHIPPSLESQRESVLQLLREGLDAMGNSVCSRDGVIAVNVHFQ